MTCNVKKGQRGRGGDQERRVDPSWYPPCSEVFFFSSFFHCKITKSFLPDQHTLFVVFHVILSHILVIYLMLTCFPLLLHVTREVITLPPPIPPPPNWVRERRRGGDVEVAMETGSLLPPTSSVVTRCGAGTWIFELYRHGQTKTQNCSRTSTSTSDGKYREVTKGGEERRDGWRKGGVTNGDWQTSILSRAESVWLSVVYMRGETDACRDNGRHKLKKLKDFDHLNLNVTTEMQSR